MLLACLGLAACENNSYQQEAEALCEVFNPTSWHGQAKNLEPHQHQKLITERMSDAVESKEMLDILNSVSQVRPEDRYSYLQNEIGSLIGKKYECSYLRTYFQPPEFN